MEGRMQGAGASRWRLWLGRLLRLVALATVIAAAVLGGRAALAIFLDRTPSRAVWQSRLNFLIGLEIAYGVALVSALVAAPWLVRILLRARRRRVRRPWAARGVLLCA